ncbi:retrovirus-related pol polyprotein from transposon TNT 1-94 [Tanacetum coccineum]
MNMIVYQMDVKTAFLNGILREEVYVNQPDMFMDQGNLNHVNSLKEPRIPYCSSEDQGKDILLVQIYVDDIIFASTTPELCDQFSKIMCSKFKMSMMGKISFFLGLQISQSPRGKFINQSKYALESFKKYGMESSDLVDTPMVEKYKLDEDIQGKAVDPTHYRGMVGTLMYLIASRPDLTFVVCMCARYQAKPTEMHLHAIKRITLIMRVAKILDEVHREVCNYWEKGLLVGHQKGKKAMRYPVRKLNILPCLAVVLKFHFIKEQVENRVVEFYFVNTEYQLADIFTKVLGRERTEFLINKLGMRSFTPALIMSITKEQHQALDNALVPREQRLRIGNSNYRLSTTFKPKEPTFQVALDVLSFTPVYQAFLITASVPAIYMHKFWAIICSRFAQIFLAKFVDPLFEGEILAFIRELGYPEDIKSLSDVKVDTLHQPWRTFGTIINKCLRGKITGNDLLHLSRDQILWGMYYQKNVDYVYLLLEDLVYQIENKVSKKNKDMYYPRFTKVIINHFMLKDQSIPRRNKVD